MNPKQPAPCFAADGKTEVFSFSGQPLMVRAVDFNALLAKLSTASPASVGGGEDAHYEALEREHFGDPDKGTGIYAAQPQAVVPAMQPSDYAALKLKVSEIAAFGGGKFSSEEAATIIRFLDATPAPQVAVKVRDELDLIESVLKGYPDSIARADALRACRVIHFLAVATKAAPQVAALPQAAGGEATREMLRQSRDTFERNFGPHWAADWVYSDLAGLVAEPTDPQAPMELRLCESEKLVLRANQNYVFTIDPACESCVRIGKAYTDPLPETLPVGATPPASQLAVGEVPAIGYIHPLDVGRDCGITAARASDEQLPVFLGAAPKPPAGVAVAGPVGLTDEREAFEAWFKANYSDLAPGSMSHSFAWHIWRARAALTASSTAGQSNAVQAKGGE